MCVGGSRGRAPGVRQIKRRKLISQPIRREGDTGAMTVRLPRYFSLWGGYSQYSYSVLRRRGTRTTPDLTSSESRPVGPPPTAPRKTGVRRLCQYPYRPPVLTAFTVPIRLLMTIRTGNRKWIKDKTRTWISSRLSSDERDVAGIRGKRSPEKPLLDGSFFPYQTKIIGVSPKHGCPCCPDVVNMEKYKRKNGPE